MNNENNLGGMKDHHDYPHCNSSIMTSTIILFVLHIIIQWSSDKTV